MNPALFGVSCVGFGYGLARCSHAEPAWGLLIGLCLFVACLIAVVESD